MVMSNDIGIDLGTASILVYIKGKGVVLKEPSVVAIDRDSSKIMAIGEEARLMIGRTPGNIVAVRPLRQGVISDYTVTEKMLKYFINKAVGHHHFDVFRPLYLLFKKCVKAHILSLLYIPSSSLNISGISQSSKVPERSSVKISSPVVNLARMVLSR